MAEVLTIILMRLGKAKFKQKKFDDAQAVKIHQDILQNFAGDNRNYRNLTIKQKTLRRSANCLTKIIKSARASIIALIFSLKIESFQKNKLWT